MQTPEPGQYEVNLDFDPAPEPGLAYIKFAGREWVREFPAGADSLKFDRVDFPAATGPLRIYLKSGRYAEAVAYAEIKRIR